MKKIWPWLLLLLLLIIFCVWSKKDSIHTTSTTPTQVAVTPAISTVKQYIHYTITQKDTDYTLEGDFTNEAQQVLLSQTTADNASHLAITNTSIDSNLLGEESIELSNKILPHFIKNYTNGKIVYSNNTLKVYGQVTSYEAQSEMQRLLASSTLASQDHSNVVKTKPIHYSITKTLDKVNFTGVFNEQSQGEDLQKSLPASTTSNISQAAHLVDNGAIAATKSILPSFMDKYTNGEITYIDEVLTITGTVKTEENLKEMQNLLSKTTLTVVNHTSVDLEALAKAEAAMKEAEDKRLAEEKAKQEDQESKRMSEKQVNEEKMLTNALEKKIKKLLKIENIEFRSAKGTLTRKGIATVDKLANILLKYPDTKVEIAGHTDSDGSAIFNQKLSQKRVDTARARLIKMGIDPARLTAIGYGESKPLVPNTSKANKQKNRRVEIKIQGE